MIDSYLAHSAKNGYPAQSYVDHVRTVIKLALDFANAIEPYCKKAAAQIRNILELSGLYHDLGKLIEENQEVLHEDGVKGKRLPVNHEDAGVAYLKQKGEEALFSCVLVYAHHQGLPDSAVEARRTETACFRDKRETVRNYIDQELEHLLDIHQSLVSQNFKHVPEYCVGDPAMVFQNGVFLSG